MRTRTVTALALKKLRSYVWTWEIIMQKKGRYLDVKPLYILWKIDNSYGQLCPKTDLWHVHPAIIQISLHIRAVWLESSLGIFSMAKDAKFLHADNNDRSDWADERVDLSIRRARMSEAMFSDVAANFVNFPKSKHWQHWWIDCLWVKAD